MKILTSHLLFCISISPFINHQLSAQRIPCATKQMSPYSEVNKINQVTNIMNLSTSSDDVILIPVVFHVVYQYQHQNISDAQICSQLEVLNEDFSRLNADTINTPAAFVSLASKPKIQFILATRDPYGNSTNGITRTQTNVGGFYADKESPYFNYIKAGSTGGTDPWPTNKYLNIWTCNLIDAGGYAQFPWDYAASPNTDGIVLFFQFVGRVVGQSAKLGRIGTHEAGHWLGLRHIWGDSTSPTCSDDDGIADTPLQNDFYLGCPPTYTNSCGSNDMFMNYMDYTDDNCKNIFTLGQKVVLRSTLSTGGYRQNFESYIPTIYSPDICHTADASITISNLPTGATASWSISPTYLVTTNSGTGTTAITRGTSWYYNAWATITFKVHGGNGCTQNATISKQIWIGKPDSPGPIIGESAPNIGYTERYFTTVPGNGASNHVWTLPYNNPYCSYCWDFYSTPTPLDIYALVGEDQGWMQVQGTNSCGTGGASLLYILPSGSGGCNPCEIVIPNPNPTKGEVKMDYDVNKLYSIVNQTYNTNQLESPLDVMFNLRNGNGEIVFSLTTKELNPTLDFGKLDSGIYFLSVSYGNLGNDNLRIKIEK